MTRWSHLVIVSKLDYEQVLQLLEDFSASGDPDDPQARKRLRIVQAATELFIRQGYRKTSMDEVARQAGVAKGTLYLHVKTKAELMLLAIVEEKKRFAEHWREVLAPGLDPRERLRRHLGKALVLATEMPLISRLMAGDRELLAVLDEMPGALADRNEQVRRELLGQMVEEAARPHRLTAEEIEARAQVVYGLMFFSPVMADPRVRSGLSQARFAELLASMLVDGLAGPRPAPLRGKNRTRGDT